MQYVAPKIKHTKGFVKIRYQTIFLLFAFICTYNYGEYSYSNLVYIPGVVPPEDKIRIERQFTPPRNYIGFVADAIPRIAAGRLSEMFSAKWVMFSSVLMLTICMSLMPMAVHLLNKDIYLDIINVVMVLSRGCIFPAAHVMMARWSPPKERFVMGGLIYSGRYFGRSVAVFVSAWLSVSLGWQYTFYSSAALNVLLLFVWVLWVRDDPSEDEKIGEEEKKFLINSLKDDLYLYRRRLESRTPWKDIFRSGPVWAAVISKFEYVLSSSIFDYQFGKESKAFQNNNVMAPLNQAVVLSLPHFWVAVSSCFLGLIFGNLVVNGMEKVRVYRIGFFIFLLGSAINLVCFHYYETIKSYKWEVISALQLCIAGYRSTSLNYFQDVAPNYAGTLSGYQDTVGQAFKFFLELLKRYNTALWITVVTYCSVILIFLSTFVSLMYFSGDAQPWNNHCHLLAADVYFDDVYLDDMHPDDMHPDDNVS